MHAAKHGRVWLQLAVAALTLWSVSLASPGLDPRPRWHYDEWVGSWRGA